MDFLSSRRFSLICAILNTAFAVHSFSSGSIAWGVICTAFAGFCFYNYKNA